MAKLRKALAAAHMAMTSAPLAKRMEAAKGVQGANAALRQRYEELGGDSVNDGPLLNWLKTHGLGFLK